MFKRTTLIPSNSRLLRESTNKNRTQYENYDVFLTSIRDPAKEENYIAIITAYVSEVIAQFKITIPPSIEGKLSILQLFGNRKYIEKLNEEERLITENPIEEQQAQQMIELQEVKRMGASLLVRRDRLLTILALTSLEIKNAQLSLPTAEKVGKTFISLITPKIIVNAEEVRKTETSLPDLTYKGTHALIKMQFIGLAKEFKEYLTEISTVLLNKHSGEIRAFQNERIQKELDLLNVSNSNSKATEKDVVYIIHSHLIGFQRPGWTPEQWKQLQGHNMEFLLLLNVLRCSTGPLSLKHLYKESSNFINLRFDSFFNKQGPGNICSATAFSKYIQAFEHMLSHLYVVTFSHKVVYYKSLKNPPIPPIPPVPPQFKVSRSPKSPGRR